MTAEQYLKNISHPTGKIDVILDTDTANEIDDQFAVAYMLRSEDKINCRAICAAPFLNDLVADDYRPATGMERSYQELVKVLTLMDRQDMIEKSYKGSTEYLPDEKTYVESEAARKIVEISRDYTAEKPLYVVAIGAITNVASALLMDETLKERIVVVWLGGHALWWRDTDEFNMMQDVAAARVIFGCGVPLVQLPCCGVVDVFRTTGPELDYWLKGKSKIATYLAENARNAAEKYAFGKPWSRVIWDVTTIAWLLDENDRFTTTKILPCPMPTYDNQYERGVEGHTFAYVCEIKRDALFEDLFTKLAK